MKNNKWEKSENKRSSFHLSQLNFFLLAFVCWKNDNKPPKAIKKAPTHIHETNGLKYTLNDQPASLSPLT